MPTIRELPAVDAAADATTAYALPYFIDRFEGVLHDRRDEDRLAIELTAGETVTLTLAGHGDNPAPDTVLTLYDGDGKRLARNDDIDVDAGNLHSQLTFTPETSGTYYVGITAYTANPALDNAGGYALTVTARAGDGGLDSYHQAETGVTATLLVEAGDLALHGSPHADTLTGNAGANLLLGGGGDDTFVFAPGHGDDTVAEFGRGDRLDLSGLDGLNSFEGLDLAQDGPHAVIDLGEHGGGTLTLQYLDAGGLAGEDFIFAA